MADRDMLAIRVDAGRTVGLGHITRCTALAEAWSLRGGRVTFVTAGAPDAVVAALESQGFQVARIPEGAETAVLLERMTHHAGSWVVFDGYSFAASDHAAVGQAGHPVLVIDDLAHLNRYSADIVVNQNVHADDLRYTTAPHTRTLRGTRYALLRQDFVSHGPGRMLRSGAARRILVTLGGSDRFNVTANVLEGLSNLTRSIEVTVVAGALNAHATTLAAWAQREDLRMQVVSNPPNMPQLMDCADVAVAAAGSTSWELAFMGLPTIAITLSDNQRSVAAKLDAMGVCRSLGWRDDVTPAAIANAVEALLNDEAARQSMSLRGRELVDGRGAQRVVDVMRSLTPGVGVASVRESRESR